MAKYESWNTSLKIKSVVLFLKQKQDCFHHLSPCPNQMLITIIVKLGRYRYWEYCFSVILATLLMFILTLKHYPFYPLSHLLCPIFLVSYCWAKQDSTLFLPLHCLFIYLFFIYLFVSLWCYIMYKLLYCKVNIRNRWGSQLLKNSNKY